MDVNIRTDPLLGFLHRLIPVFLRHQIAPVFCHKLPVHTRCHIQCDHGRLNGDRTTAAERIHKHPVRAPWRQKDHSRRQRLCNRCRCCKLTVSSFVERFSCGVNTYRNHIFYNADTKRIRGPGLFKPGAIIGFLHTLYHGFFHNTLYVRRTEQLTADRISLCHPEFAILRNIFLPGNGFDILKQLIKCSRLKLRHLQQNTLCRTQKKVCTGNGLCIPFKRHFPIVHISDLISQIQDLSLQHRLHAKMAGRDQFKSSHNYLNLRIF